jgi:hypothetical protein
MKILIGTPTKSGSVSHRYAASLALSIPLLQQEGFTVEYLPVPGQLVEHARNYIAARALSTGADKVVYLDDDVSWEPRDLVRLVTLPHALIGATYRKKDPSVEKYAVLFPDTARDDQYGAVEARYIPGGFMKVERHVFEQMSANLQPYPHPAVLETAEEPYMFPFFKVLTSAEPGHSAGESEDMWFCVEWQRLGGVSWVYPDIRVQHTTEITLQSYFRQYLERITTDTRADRQEEGGRSNEREQ